MSPPLNRALWPEAGYYGLPTAQAWRRGPGVGRRERGGKAERVSPTVSAHTSLSFPSAS